MVKNDWKVQEKYLDKNPLLRLVNRKFSNALIKFVLFSNPASVLDIGCGEGFITYNVGKTVDSRILAIDKEQIAIEYARANNKLNNVEYKVGDLFNLKYKDNSFDLIMCMEVLEHLDKFELALNIMSKLSKKHLLISVPNEPWFRIANILRLKYLKRFGNTPGHVNNWTKKEFKNLCSRYGKIVKFKTSTFWNIVLLEIKDK